MVETFTIDGQTLSDAEIEALLAALEEPLDRDELQRLIDESNQESSRALADLLAAIAVLSIVALATLPRRRISYSARERAYYRGRAPLSREQIRTRLNAEQQRNATRMRRRTQQMIDGQLSVSEWQRQSSRDIIRSHFRMTQAGAGTAGGLTRRHIQASRTAMRDELEYFNRFAQQVVAGELTERMILHRASVYGFSTAASYWQAENISHSDGRWLARRLLDPGAPHCPSCPAHQRLNWVPADSVTPVGVDCECRGRCKCRVEYSQVNFSDRLVSSL